MALMFLLPQRKKRKQVQIVSRETDSSINQQRLTAVTELCEIYYLLLWENHSDQWSLQELDKRCVGIWFTNNQCDYWILQEKRLQGWELSHPGPTVSLGNFPNSTTLYIQYSKYCVKTGSGKMVVTYSSYCIFRLTVEYSSKVSQVM